MELRLLVVICITCVGQTCGEVYWVISNKPVIYGDDIILTCKTGYVLTNTDKCPVRQWYGGHRDKLLLYSEIPLDKTKYGGRRNMSSTEFSLVIKNYTESDLNVPYTCSCGFRSYSKRLDLNDKDFIVPPLRVDTHMQQSNETLSIHIQVERVYPRPECSMVIGERTVFANETLTSVKRNIFFNAIYERSFKIVDDDCGKKPILLCYIGNKYNIVNTSGDPMPNCIEVRGDGTIGYNDTSTESDIVVIDITTSDLAVIVTLVVLILVCLTVAVILYISKYTYFCKSNQIRNNIYFLFFSFKEKE